MMDDDHDYDDDEDDDVWSWSIFISCEENNFLIYSKIFSFPVKKNQKQYIARFSQQHLNNLPET